uniref:Uncharacterized protein n=1 Tax=Chromera velia CCMP2878 TaxID=1169474 RepID=A0A0G4F2G7_9ALVE|eukprot:Cvel_14769.t1-p1 / transcript=Cvel_14769.t1 / gene=Cvel_14769 / organism=Chromera_velia_CCMP2878 / gene_product=hypothetical protein / transcript_product=hypothetical protein / location=Cvel_scaffold1063:36203-45718(-) / protein_length=2211 / sequence_SO=supercontig / SO=protein_coding / is_pseudo=false
MLARCRNHQESGPTGGDDKTFSDRNPESLPSHSQYTQAAVNGTLFGTDTVASEIRAHDLRTFATRLKSVGSLQTDGDLFKLPQTHGCGDADADKDNKGGTTPCCTVCIRSFVLSALLSFTDLHRGGPQHPPQKETLEASTDADPDISEIITTLRDLPLDDQRRLFFQAASRPPCPLVLSSPSLLQGGDGTKGQGMTGSASTRAENEPSSVVEKPKDKEKSRGFGTNLNLNTKRDGINNDKYNTERSRCALSCLRWLQERAGLQMNVSLSSSVESEEKISMKEKDRDNDKKRNIASARLEGTLMGAISSDHLPVVVSCVSRMHSSFSFSLSGTKKSGDLSVSSWRDGVSVLLEVAEAVQSPLSAKFLKAFLRVTATEKEGEGKGKERASTAVKGEGGMSRLDDVASLSTKAGWGSGSGMGNDKEGDRDRERDREQWHVKTGGGVVPLPECSASTMNRSSFPFSFGSLRSSSPSLSRSLRSLTPPIEEAGEAENCQRAYAGGRDSAETLNFFAPSLVKALRESSVMPFPPSADEASLLSAVVAGRDVLFISCDARPSAHLVASLVLQKLLDGTAPEPPTPPKFLSKQKKVLPVTTVFPPLRPGLSKLDQAIAEKSAFCSIVTKGFRRAAALRSCLEAAFDAGVRGALQQGGVRCGWPIAALESCPREAFVVLRPGTGGGGQEGTTQNKNPNMARRHRIAILVLDYEFLSDTELMDPLVVPPDTQNVMSISASACPFLLPFNADTQIVVLRRKSCSWVKGFMEAVGRRKEEWLEDRAEGFVSIESRGPAPYFSPASSVTSDCPETSLSCWARLSDWAKEKLQSVHMGGGGELHRSERMEGGDEMEYLSSSEWSRLVGELGRVAAADDLDWLTIFRRRLNFDDRLRVCHSLSVSPADVGLLQSCVKEGDRPGMLDAILRGVGARASLKGEIGEFLRFAGLLTEEDSDSPAEAGGSSGVWCAVVVPFQILWGGAEVDNPVAVEWVREECEGWGGMCERSFSLTDMTMGSLCLPEGTDLDGHAMTSVMSRMSPGAFLACVAARAKSVAFLEALGAAGVLFSLSERELKEGLPWLDDHSRLLLHSPARILQVVDKEGEEEYEGEKEDEEDGEGKEGDGDEEEGRNSARGTEGEWRVVGMKNGKPKPSRFALSRSKAVTAAARDSRALLRVAMEFGAIAGPADLQWSVIGVVRLLCQPGMELETGRGFVSDFCRHLVISICRTGRLWILQHLCETDSLPLEASTMVRCVAEKNFEQMTLGQMAVCIAAENGQRPIVEWMLGSGLCSWHRAIDTHARRCTVDPTCWLEGDELEYVSPKRFCTGVTPRKGKVKKEGQGEEGSGEGGGTEAKDSKATSAKKEIERPTSFSQTQQQQQQQQSKGEAVQVAQPKILLPPSLSLWARLESEFGVSPFTVSSLLADDKEKQKLAVEAVGRWAKRDSELESFFSSSGMSIKGYVCPVRNRLLKGAAEVGNVGVLSWVVLKKKVSLVGPHASFTKLYGLEENLVVDETQLILICALEFSQKIFAEKLRMICGITPWTPESASRLRKNLLASGKKRLLSHLCAYCPQLGVASAHEEPLPPSPTSSTSFPPLAFCRPKAASQTLWKAKNPSPNTEAQTEKQNLEITGGGRRTGGERRPLHPSEPSLTQSLFDKEERFPAPQNSPISSFAEPLRHMDLMSSGSQKVEEENDNIPLRTHHQPPLLSPAMTPSMGGPPPSPISPAASPLRSPGATSQQNALALAFSSLSSNTPAEKEKETRPPPRKVSFLSLAPYAERDQVDRRAVNSLSNAQQRERERAEAEAEERRKTAEVRASLEAAFSAFGGNDWTIPVDNPQPPTQSPTDMIPLPKEPPALCPARHPDPSFRSPGAGPFGALTEQPVNPLPMFPTLLSPDSQRSSSNANVPCRFPPLRESPRLQPQHSPKPLPVSPVMPPPGFEKSIWTLDDHNPVPVIVAQCVCTGSEREFTSLRSCALALGINEGTVGRALQGTMGSVSGYEFFTRVQQTHKDQTHTGVGGGFTKPPNPSPDLYTTTPPPGLSPAPPPGLYSGPRPGMKLSAPPSIHQAPPPRMNPTSPPGMNAMGMNHAPPPGLFPTPPPRVNQNLGPRVSPNPPPSIWNPQRGLFPTPSTHLQRQQYPLNAGGRLESVCEDGGEMGCHSARLQGGNLPPVGSPPIPLASPVGGGGGLGARGGGSNASFAFSLGVGFGRNQSWGRDEDMWREREM